ncbi:MAG: hypothetical protein A2W52_03370 [Candidatus Taylorbacteria bacterium RIFCSPHIGHO2_02_49_25]|uniref:YdbS-like PH domain-containing protein n=1 Tax=Candidatus Taylorbacteria bacterium RIFCSPHIGHO2_02_49_25 TaxID=1802305 RepID=A0A1G2MDB8_9BACT|nr:MAG: hypothetical protein UY62_C0034G0012 [Parcubacteria group bacterium GW2011_GWF2_50_9]OHA21915.1 MAG: hypothetical protein A2W52_03370 [Candidatus Taylorbacteria bacterium RIFCSPHIGHO2_02_49_25]
MPPLEQNEKILYTARKHWFLLAGEIILLCVLALLPGLLLFVPDVLPEIVVNTFNERIHIEGNTALIVAFLWTIELLMLCIAFFFFWTDYYLDVWLVTNLRVIAIEQKGLFNRNVSTFRLDMIQDATVKIPGFLATLLRFGTVEVSTASDGSFAFKGAGNPNALKEKIMMEHHRAQNERQEVHIRGNPIQDSK